MTTFISLSLSDDYCSGCWRKDTMCPDLNPAQLGSSKCQCGHKLTHHAGYEKHKAQIEAELLVKTKQIIKIQQAWRKYWYHTRPEWNQAQKILA